MGRASQTKPARLADKLLQIRTALSLSQNGLIRHIGLQGLLTQADVSAFERGIRIPSLPVLMCYAKVEGVYIDWLVDDDLSLPKKLPARVRKN
jgi:transcriptional regulator with XRE-family HTH domain